MTTVATMIAIKIAIDIGMKYRSAIDGVCAGWGVGVAAAGSTANDVTAWEE